MATPGIRVFPPTWSTEVDERMESRRRGVHLAVIFGIVAPLTCLVLDPVVFRAGGPFGFLRTPVWGAYAVAAYILVAIALVALIVWLRQPRWAPVLAGPLLVGGLAAAVVAIGIFPLALFGLVFFGLGLLGLLPIGTAWVYLRAGWRALRAVARRRRSGTWILALVLAGLSVVLPLLAQRAVDRRTHELVDAAVQGDDAALAHAIERLKPFGWLADAKIVLRRRAGIDSPLRQRLEEAWIAAGGTSFAVLVD
jgi:hypothetical protein